MPVTFDRVLARMEGDVAPGGQQPVGNDAGERRLASALVATTEDPTLFRHETGVDCEPSSGGI